MHIGGHYHDRMDQVRGPVFSRLDFNGEKQLATLLGLVHFEIPLPLLILSRVISDDQDGFDDRALPHRHASLTVVILAGLQEILAKFMLLH